MKRNLLAAAVLVTGTLVVTACAGHSTAQNPESIGVRVTIARLGSLSSTAEFSGSLVAREHATVEALSPGRIETVAVHVGDRLSAGMPIASVNASSYAAAFRGAEAGAEAARSSLSAAKAGLAVAQSRYALADTTAGRMTRLYVAGAISKERRDQVQTQREIARASLAQARAEVNAAAGERAQADAVVSGADAPLQNATIVAPFSGIVTKKYVRRGEVVGPGSPIVELQGSSGLELTVAIPLIDLGEIQVGSTLPVRVDSASQIRMLGRVRSVVPADDPALRSVMLRLAIPNRPGLLSGMFARVRVKSIGEHGTIVPLRALIVRAGQTGVFAIKRGKATFLPVETISTNDTAALLGGIAPGTTIAASHLSEITDGAAVTVEHQ